MKKPVIILGVFDGVHLGHRYIFKRAIQRAKKIGGTSIVYTFDPHPVKILVPEAAPPMINTISQREELIRAQGIEKVIVQKFTKPFSKKRPKIFFQEVLVKRLRAEEIFVGYNFTFGIHRSGTVELLETLAKVAGIKTHIIDPFLYKETMISSTHIRGLLSSGHLKGAEALLGRPYFIEGKVIRGRGIGGKELGIHTANLDSENDLFLPMGVYATYTQIAGKRYQSITNIGPNPTFGAGTISIETHILHFTKNIVGKKIRVEFLEKIREEITFRSPEDLALQIRNDIKIALDHFRKRR